MRRWALEWVKSAAATLGAIYIVGWFVLTFGVAWINSITFITPRFTNTARRLVVSDAVRPYGLTPDPSITPERAGRAYAALITPPKTPPRLFPEVAIADRPSAPWRGPRQKLTVLGELQDPAYNGPDHTKILAAVKRGFTPAEQALLRAYATAPAWREFDMVARAPAADMLGTRFVLPFHADAMAFEMPAVKFAETKEMAYASVARAAWHLSQGRRDSAEFALRSTISFGRAISDNSSFVIEELIGAVITNIGRDALVQLYTLTGDPRAAAMTTATATAATTPLVPAAISAIGTGDPRASRAALLELATSRETPRGLRFEALSALNFSSCATPRGLLTGPDASVRAAFDQAKRELARYPSEVALLDMISGTLERMGRRMEPTGEVSGELTPERVLALAGRIYFNPRLAACALATPLGMSNWNVIR